MLENEKIRMENEKLLNAALLARKKREEAKRRVEEARSVEQRRKVEAKKAEERRKKAEKAEKTLKGEREILIKLAGIKPESKSSRGYFSSKGFFDLLNLFNGIDGEFSQKYNSINIEEVAKLVLQHARHGKTKEGKEFIVLWRQELDAALDARIKEREETIATAKQLLDQEYQKVLLQKAKTFQG